MNYVTDISIDGLGFILYSPWAVSHIRPGLDYLRAHFWEPNDVGSHVRDCTITAFCTGSPGDFKIHVTTDEIDLAALEVAEYKIALGIEVRDEVVCIRDLYDLSDWDTTCPLSQEFSIENGFYHITAYTSAPASGVLGDQQSVHLCFRKVPNKPELTWQGVPSLC